MTQARSPDFEGVVRADGHETRWSLGNDLGRGQVVQDLVGKWPSKLLLSHTEMTPKPSFSCIYRVNTPKATGCEGI